MTEPAQLVYRPIVALRGARSYVHSTDLYAEILSGAQALFGAPCQGPLTITFRALCAGTPRIFYCKSDPSEGEPVAEFSIGVAHLRVAGAVLSEPPCVSARKPYDETRICAAATIDGDAIASQRDVGAEPIEVLTALGVALLNTRLPPKGSKWLLGKLQLTRPLRGEDAGGIRLALRANAAGNVAQLQALSEGQALGNMMFMLHKVVAVDVHRA